MKELFWLVVWTASFAGYTWLCTDQLRLPAAGAPLAAMSLLTLGTYAGGMLRMLQPAALLLLLLGLGMFAVMLFTRSRALLRPELLVFALACAALWMRYRGALLVAYDDFSHWGMIVRHMLVHNRLPGAQDALITFQSYPPGAACWLYYACRFLGGSDGMMLTCQAVMTLAGWLPVLALAKKPGTVFKTAAAAAAALIGLSLFQGTASLMVDNLISALAVGAMCLLAAGTGNVWMVGTLAAVICLVKDSGLFFAAIVLVCGAALIIRQKETGRYGQMARLAALPVLARAAWFAHIKWAFPAADVSRHAMTIENLRATGSDKSYADMFEIGGKLLERVFSLQNQAVQILLLLLVCMAAYVVLRGVSTGEWQMRRETAVWSACAAVYAAWVGFLWIMYVFSMTITNAMQLVAFERYNSTCALFLYGVLVMWLCKAEWKGLHKASVGLVLAALIPLGIASWTAGIPRLFRENYFVPLRSRMDQLYRAYAPVEGESAAVIVSPQDDSVYADYMARYTFQTPLADAVSDAGAVQAQVYYVACSEKIALPPDAHVVRLSMEDTQEDNI